MKQRELAHKVGVTPQHLNAVLKGRAKASAVLASRIQEATGGEVRREVLRPDVFGPLPQTSAA